MGKADLANRKNGWYSKRSSNVEEDRGLFFRANLYDRYPDIQDKNQFTGGFHWGQKKKVWRISYG